MSVSPSDGDRPRGPGGSADEFRGADRGQLMLVAALVVAVSLLTLVVLLNATIYSEAVATRGVEAADGEALEVRAAAVEGTGTLIDATNREGVTDPVATSPTGSPPSTATSPRGTRDAGESPTWRPPRSPRGDTSRDR
ncbi:hypothetical protein [Halorubrum sp. CBA1125]|uniref:DUF7261 family protein n=1 Tax=Halorubrum sp. CBA1125 TaxID=2668072 RepID=UPI001E608B7D|nr:hypothetical protein [Halorubrum sp. CBA1125]